MQSHLRYGCLALLSGGDWALPPFWFPVRGHYIFSFDVQYHVALARSATISLSVPGTAMSTLLRHLSTGPRLIGGIIAGVYFHVHHGLGVSTKGLLHLRRGRASGMSTKSLHHCCPIGSTSCPNRWPCMVRSYTHGCCCRCRSASMG